MRPTGRPLISVACGCSIGNGGVADVGVINRSRVARNSRTRCHWRVRRSSPRATSREVSASPCSVFSTSPSWSTARCSGSLSAWRATIRSPRVRRTISGTSLRSGPAASTRAPAERNTATAPSNTVRTSSSIVIKPPRSGVHATVEPFTDGVFTALTSSRGSTS
jgi:hypothetical protein